MKALTVPSNYKITKAFVAAVKAGDLARIEDTLKNGANINVAKFPRGSTALIHCAAREQTSIVRCLLKYTPDLDHRNNACLTALMLAAVHGHAEIIKMLLEQHCNTQLTEINGYTAAELAERNGHTTLAQNILIASQQNYNGFIKENDHTVSRHEILEASNKTLLKVFNFETQEVTTLADSAPPAMQDFNQIAAHRIEAAEDALKALGGHPGDWQKGKPISPMKSAANRIS